MIKRKYGKNKELLSIVGLGGISVKGEGQNKANDIASKAYDKGVNYFDVAPGYGDAQELFGKALISFRKNIFLACKTAKRDQKESLKDLENSLRLLKTDYFDLYQLHGMKTKEDFEKVISPGGAMETLIKAKEDGKVKNLGFSCHSIEVAKLLINHYDFDSILFPVNWALILKNDFGPEIISICKEKNISILALKAMANKMWDDNIRGKYQNCWYEPLDDDEMIKLSIRFTLSQPIVSFLPPGNPDLFLKGLEYAEKFQPITEEELNLLAIKAKNTNTIGSKTEVFI